MPLIAMLTFSDAFLVGMICIVGFILVDLLLFAITFIFLSCFQYSSLMLRGKSKHPSVDGQSSNSLATATTKPIKLEKTKL